jgi:hypothetical protein
MTSELTGIDTYSTAIQGDDINNWKPHPKQAQKHSRLIQGLFRRYKMSPETRDQVKFWTILAALALGLLSIGAHAAGKNNSFTLCCDILSASCWILWIRMKLFPSETYQDKVFASMIFVAITTCALLLAILLASFTHNKIGESIASINIKALMSEFQENIRSLWKGFIATKDAMRNGSIDPIRRNGIAFVWIVAIFGLMVTTGTIFKQGLVNTIPDGFKEGTRKLMAWSLILAILGGIAYGAWKLL